MDSLLYVCILINKPPSESHSHSNSDTTVFFATIYNTGCTGKGPGRNDCI